MNYVLWVPSFLLNFQWEGCYFIQYRVSCFPFACNFLVWVTKTLCCPRSGLQALLLIINVVLTSSCLGLHNFLDRGLIQRLMYTMLLDYFYVPLANHIFPSKSPFSTCNYLNDWYEPHTAVKPYWCISLRFVPQVWKGVLKRWLKAKLMSPASSPHLRQGRCVSVKRILTNWWNWLITMSWITRSWLFRPCAWQ